MFPSQEKGRTTSSLCTPSLGALVIDVVASESRAVGAIEEKRGKISSVVRRRSLTSYLFRSLGRIWVVLFRTVGVSKHAAKRPCPKMLLLFRGRLWATTVCGVRETMRETLAK